MKITQETFDAIVKSNIEDFEISPEEALAEAIDQFESRGIDLSGILKRVPGESEPSIIANLKHLDDAVKNEDFDRIEFHLDSILQDLGYTSTAPLSAKPVPNDACSLAISRNGLDVLSVVLLSDFEVRSAILHKALAVLSTLLTIPVQTSSNEKPSLTYEQAVLARDRARDCNIIQHLIRLWTSTADQQALLSVCETSRLLVMLNERNRNEFSKAGLRVPLDTISKHTSSIQDHLLYKARVIRTCCKFIRAMLLDDDKRSDFGSTTDTAKKLADLGAITTLLTALRSMPELQGAMDAAAAASQNQPDGSGTNENCDDENDNYNSTTNDVGNSNDNENDNENDNDNPDGQSDSGRTARLIALTVSEILNTMGRLCVREEICVDIESQGGIPLAIRYMNTVGWHQGVARSGCNFIRGVCGSDLCKDTVREKGGLKVLTGLMNAYVGVCAPVVVSAASAFASVSLRSEQNCEALGEEGALTGVLDAMKVHASHPMINKACCHAVRNIVARCPANKKKVIDHGGEELIRFALNAHPPASQHAKAALRDLGLKVELREDWKGTGKKLEHAQDAHYLVKYAVDAEED